MSENLLVDTDVLIDYLRGQEDAVDYIESLTQSLLMSTITMTELYAGVREGDERTKLDTFVKAFELVDIDPEIAVKGGLYRRDYKKSHHVGLADALIAATVDVKQAKLVTLNSNNSTWTLQKKEEESIMQMTTEGRITIPQYVRERLRLTPQAEVNFVEENGRFYLVKMSRISTSLTKSKFHRFRGAATVKMRTDDIMQLTRGES